MGRLGRIIFATALALTMAGCSAPYSHIHRASFLGHQMNKPNRDVQVNEMFDRNALRGEYISFDRGKVEEMEKHGWTLPSYLNRLQSEQRDTPINGEYFNNLTRSNGIRVLSFDF